MDLGVGKLTVAQRTFAKSSRRYAYEVALSAMVVDLRVHGFHSYMRRPTEMSIVAYSVSHYCTNYERDWLAMKHRKYLFICKLYTALLEV